VCDSEILGQQKSRTIEREAEDHRMDVAAWLQGLGLERYVPAFRDNEIDWGVLPKLTSVGGSSGTCVARAIGRAPSACVSLTSKFPASRENTGNLVRLGLLRRLLARNTGPNTIAYDPIPYASEQGI
jgi:hypothetical protein